MAHRLDRALDDVAASPWLYPGMRPETSGLLQARTYSPLTPHAGGQVGQASVDVPGTGPRERLDHVLLSANVAPVDQRVVVLAVGSNASPAVIRRKLSQGGVSTTVPFIKAAVTGIRVTHSAHVSRPGYIAATPIAAVDSTTELIAALLDREQLACLDMTEPSYNRLLLSAEQFPFELDCGESPASFYVYDSKRHALTRPGQGPVPVSSQKDLFARLAADCPPFSALVDAVEFKQAMRALAGSAALRDEVRRCFTESGWTSDSGLGGGPSG